MKRTWKQTLSVCLSLAMVVTSLVAGSSEAAGKAKLSTKKLNLTVGQKKKIAIKGKKAKAKYTFSSSAKAKASVSKKGVITAKKTGKATNYRQRKIQEENTQSWKDCSNDKEKGKQGYTYSNGFCQPVSFCGTGNYTNSITISDTCVNTEANKDTGTYRIS